MVARKDDGLKLFYFYTYDPCGRDVVIPIRAIDEDSAFDSFRAIYGSTTLIDQIIEK